MRDIASLTAESQTFPAEISSLTASNVYGKARMNFMLNKISKYLPMNVHLERPVLAG